MATTKQEKKVEKADTEPSESFHEAKSKKRTEIQENSSVGPVTIIGEEVHGKGETRRFQTGPNTHEWLTKEEAENPPKNDDGTLVRPKFFWSPDPKGTFATQARQR